MKIEIGKTYRGGNGAQLRVYKVDAAAGTAVVEQPTTLRQWTMPCAELEAWAVAEDGLRQERLTDPAEG